MHTTMKKIRVICFLNLRNLRELSQFSLRPRIFWVIIFWFWETAFYLFPIGYKLVQGVYIIP